MSRNDEFAQITEQPPPRGPNKRPQPYQFTPDEMRVLRECTRDSFYQRCLPLSTMLGGLTWYSIKTGIFKGNPRFGASPKVATAVIFGYFLGKLSYHQVCSEKFMALPDSKVGRAIKARRLGKPEFEQEETEFKNYYLSPFSGITDSSDNQPSQSQFDYSDTHHNVQGLDDSFRPSLDNQIILHKEEMPPEQKHVTTYEELRRQNRDEYEQKRVQSYRQVSPTPQPTQVKQREPEFSSDKNNSAPKNKYGDTWG